MHHLNPRAVRRAYDADLQAILHLRAASSARATLAGWRALAPSPTPVWRLPGLAAALGLASLSVKDESRRASLGSFKALGAPYALVQLLLRRFPDVARWRITGEPTFGPSQLIRGYRHLPMRFT